MQKKNNNWHSWCWIKKINRRIFFFYAKVFVDNISTYNYEYTLLSLSRECKFEEKYFKHLKGKNVCIIYVLYFYVLGITIEYVLLWKHLKIKNVYCAK